MSELVFEYPNIRMQMKLSIRLRDCLVCTFKLSISLIKCQKVCLGRYLTLEICTIVKRVTLKINDVVSVFNMFLIKFVQKLFTSEIKQKKC